MPAMPHGISAYASSKAAATKLFEYIGVEEGAKRGLHVVNVQPGIVDSELNRKSSIPGADHGEYITLPIFIVYHVLFGDRFGVNLVWMTDD